MRTEIHIPLSVIDDIKAEIKKPHDVKLGQLESRSNGGILRFAMSAYDKGIKYALSIIDKHISGAKMESEGVKKDCTTCILDGTDACVSGASDDVCEGYIAESEE